MDYWARLSYEAADAMLARRQCVTEPMPAVVSGGGSVTPVPYVKHDEKRVDWHTAGGTNHDAAPAAKASKCGGTSHDAVGTGNSLSEAEIDALQHVVKDGRIVRMQDYGCLRAMLVRLRPEWEGDDDSDRPKPINPMIKAQQRTPDQQTTPGEGNVRNWCASGREAELRHE